MTDSYIHVDIDCTTGERTERSLSAEEIALREAATVEAQAAHDAITEALEARAAARASAIAKLQEQGLTQEEIDALYS
jgi:hypothetical protein